MSQAVSIRFEAKKTIGIKQSLKAVQKDLAAEIWIAADVDPQLVEELRTLCSTKALPVLTAASKKELGRACRIRTGAAAVAILKTV